MAYVERAALAAVALLMMGGCGSDSPARDALGDATWVLTSGSADGSSLVLVDSNPLTLSASGDAALWSTGCNNYEADVSVDGNAVSFFTVARTEEDCDDLVAELEDAFLGALERIDVLERNREQLLLSGESVELTFVPRPDA